MKRKLRSLLSLALALLLAAALTLPASAAMQIEHNITSLNEHRNLTNFSSSDLRKSAEKLGSQLRLNMQADSVSRGEGVRALAIASLGVEAAEALPIPATAPFDDVPVDDPDAMYIEWAKMCGFIDGNGDGSFGPDDELIPTAYAKMLLGALGYDSAREGYVGAEWETNVTRTALEIGLFVVVDDDGKLGDSSYEPLSPSSGNITSDDSGIRHGVLDPDELAQLIKDYIAADNAVSGSDAVGLLVTASTLPRSPYDDPSSSFGFGGLGLTDTAPLTTKHLAVAQAKDDDGTVTLSGRWITDDDVELKRDGETVTLKGTYTAYPWEGGIAIPADARVTLIESLPVEITATPTLDENGEPLLDGEGNPVVERTLSPLGEVSASGEDGTLAGFFDIHPNEAGWIHVFTLLYDEDGSIAAVIAFTEPIAYPLTGSSVAPSVALPDDGCCGGDYEVCECTCVNHEESEEFVPEYCGHEDCWCYMELFPGEFGE